MANSILLRQVDAAVRSAHLPVRELVAEDGVGPNVVDDRGPPAAVVRQVLVLQPPLLQQPLPGRYGRRGECGGRPTPFSYGVLRLTFPDSSTPWDQILLLGKNLVFELVCFDQNSNRLFSPPSLRFYVVAFVLFAKNRLSKNGKLANL